MYFHKSFINDIIVRLSNNNNLAIIIRSVFKFKYSMKGLLIGILITVM